MLNKRLKRKCQVELIISRYQPAGPFPFVLILDHLKAGYNVGKIIRTANAFGCKEVHLIGVTVFNPNSAKGALRHTKTRSFKEFSESYNELSSLGYEFYALDPQDGEILGEARLSEKSVFVLGHEEFGFSFDQSKFPRIKQLRIQQFGQVQSLNVSVAASLACYEYVRQLKPVGRNRTDAVADATVL